MFVLFDPAIERLFVWIFSCLSTCCFNSKFTATALKVTKISPPEMSLLVSATIEFSEFKKIWYLIGNTKGHDVVQSGILFYQNSILLYSCLLDYFKFPTCNLYWKICIHFMLFHKHKCTDIQTFWHFICTSFNISTYSQRFQPVLYLPNI